MLFYILRVISKANQKARLYQKKFLWQPQFWFIHPISYPFKIDYSIHTAQIILTNFETSFAVIMIFGLNSCLNAKVTVSLCHGCSWICSLTKNDNHPIVGETQILKEPYKHTEKKIKKSLETKNPKGGGESYLNEVKTSLFIFWYPSVCLLRHESKKKM